MGNCLAFRKKQLHFERVHVAIMKAGLVVTQRGAVFSVEGTSVPATVGIRRHQPSIFPLVLTAHPFLRTLSTIPCFFPSVSNYWCQEASSHNPWINILPNQLTYSSSKHDSSELAGPWSQIPILNVEDFPSSLLKAEGEYRPWSHRWQPSWQRLGNRVVVFVPRHKLLLRSVIEDHETMNRALVVSKYLFVAECWQEGRSAYLLH